MVVIVPAFLTLFLYIPLLPVVTSGQLYLQPSKTEHGYFTNDSFFITCFTTDETTDELTWKGADENVITESGRIHVQPASGMQQGLELVVESVQREDAGQYVCSNVQESLSFDLRVYKSISFGQTPKVQFSAEYENAVINCQVKADPSPVVNWYYNGSKLLTNGKYEVESETLTIFNVSRHDAGFYKCKAIVITSLSTQVKEIDISFEVHYVPEWLDDSDAVVYAGLDSLATLSCATSANPEPLFQWLKNGEVIHADSDYSVINNGSETYLQFTVEDKEQFGLYTCRASNNLGWSERAVELKEGVVPDEPVVSVVSEGIGTLTLSIKVQHEMPGGMNVSVFKVQYALAGAEWDDAETVEFRRDEPYILKNVSYNTEYMIRAASKNAAGYSKYSDDIRHTTNALQVASVVADDAFHFTSSMHAVSFSGCMLLYATYWLVGK